MSRVIRNVLAAAAVSTAVGWGAAAAWAQDAANPTTNPTAAPGGDAAAPAPAGSLLTPPYHVGRLSYDSHCMTVDGRDVQLFSGAFHYFRCPKPLWADRFRTLKNAGFNCLETYAAWDWHERTPPKGPDDTSKLDMADLRDWVDMAVNQFGFYLVIRPGPYICAEWDGGGYPQWLLPLRPADYKPKQWLRSDEPQYLAWGRHWYAAVAGVCVPYQVTHRPAGSMGGVVLWQIENEYDYSSQPIGVKVNQLRYLAHASRELGVDVPLLTCETNAAAFHRDDYLRANVVQSANSYAGFNMAGLTGTLDRVHKQQPEKFAMVTELQGGWFAQVGGKLSDQQGYNAAQINQITLTAWERGCSVTNYYMGFGGTNPGDWAAQGLIASYDYDAPVREAGGTTDRYQAVRALGQLVAEHGPAMARSSPADADVRVDDKAVHVAVRRAVDGDYVFVRTATRHEDHHGPLGVTVKGDHPRTIEADYALGDFGAKVLFAPADGSAAVWYPKPQAEPKRPAKLPAAVTIADARRTVDPGPTVWQPCDTERSAEQYGVLDRMPIFYRATLPTAAVATGSDQRLGLSFDLAGRDEAVVTVEGKRVKPDPAYGSYPVAGATHEGSLTATVLYDNAGRPNFGDGLEQPSGLLHGRATATTAPPAALGGWREHHVPSGQKVAGETASDVDDGAWPAADVSTDAGDLAPGETAVYRTTVTLTDAQAAEGRTLTLGSVDDNGQVYVNGQPAAAAHDWSMPVHVDLTKLLHPGRNTVAVVVHNRDGSGGLCKGATLGSTGKPMAVQWTFSQDGQGSLNHWYEPSFDDAGWPAVRLSDAPPADEAGALLTWTRMRFELPTPTPNVWVPWRLTLAAGGNGFVYLNGHCLGRWWEVGPQRDFYLPECWLNTGPGQANVVTVALHPTENAAAVRSAVVQPYGEQAEVR